MISFYFFSLRYEFVPVNDWIKREGKNPEIHLSIKKFVHSLRNMESNKQQWEDPHTNSLSWKSPMPSNGGMLSLRSRSCYLDKQRIIIINMVSSMTKLCPSSENWENDSTYDGSSGTQISLQPGLMYSIQFYSQLSCLNRFSLWLHFWTEYRIFALRLMLDWVQNSRPNSCGYVTVK